MNKEERTRKEAQYAQAVRDAAARNEKRLHLERSKAEVRRAAEEQRAERKARDSRACANLSTVVQELGGVRKTAREVGAPVAVVQGWVKPNRKTGRRSKPSFLYLALLAEKTSYSIDWLCGFSVEKQRSDLVEGGDLGSQLRSHITTSLRQRGCQSSLIRAFVPPGGEILNLVVSLVHENINDQQDAVLRRAVGDVLEIARVALDDGGLSDENELALFRLVWDKERLGDRIPQAMLKRVIEARLVADGLEFGLEEDHADRS
jgi:hypothetical protein